MAKHILIVEEQAQTANALLEGLSSLGPAVHAERVSSAAAALQVLAQRAPDLLIADLLLPGISGLELMARFRQQQPAVGVILLSQVHDEALRSQAARSGANGFFFKPFELADVLDTVERHLGLVKTSLPAELAVIAAAAADAAPLLAELRQTLQAYCVALLSARGQVLARAGVLLNPQLEAELLPYLLNARRAAQHMARVLGSAAPDDLLTIRGAQEHLHLANLADGRGLCILTRPLSAARTAALAQALQRSARQLAGASPLPTPAGPVHTETDPELEQLLTQADTRPTPVAAERFWQPTELNASPLAGALSYAQAAQIGLTPQQ